MLRIAVQSKGRLFEDTIGLLAEAGIKISSSKRTLLVQSSNFPIEVLYLRDDDIPQSVASGVADLGIVGQNEYEERAEDAKVVRPLGFSKCRLSLAVPKGCGYYGLKWFDGKKIATSYPSILRRYLQKNCIASDVHVITGSVTLVSNNLVEVETVMQSEAILIANKNLDDEKQAVLDELLFRIEAVKAAEDKKYILMNVPTDRVKDVVAVLPGAKSPTVMPLATEGWSSVHTVIEEKRFWEIIRELKQLGAEGILVVPIEKMIP